MEIKPGYTAEEALIGSLIIDWEKCWPRVTGLERGHFENQNMALAFDAISRLSQKGEAVDIVSVVAEVPRLTSLLVEICENFPGSFNFDKYREYVQRQFHASNLKKLFKRGSESPDQDVIKKIRDEWEGMESLGAKKFDFVGQMTAYSDVLENRGKGEETFYPTGFATLDYKVPLLKRGELCMIAARPGLGKTSLLLSIMLSMSKSGLKCVYASGEMSFNQLMDRILALQSGIHLLDIRKGSIRKDDWPKIMDVFGELGDRKIRFVEAARLTFDKIMPHVVEFKPDVLFIDYVQRFTPDSKVNNRAAYFSDVANGMKGLSIEHNMVVIAASQLGREVEYRKDQEPKLSDLKESGGLEEASDVVWALHRIGLPDQQMTDYRMMIMKNRNGPTFNFNAMFDSFTTRFRERED